MRVKNIIIGLLGEGATGKTTFALTLSGQKVSRTLMTVAPTAHVLKISDVFVTLWDFPGQRIFRIAVENKLRSSDFHVIFFFIDASGMSRLIETLSALPQWYKMLSDDVKNKALKYIIINKADIPTSVINEAIAIMEGKKYTTLIEALKEYIPDLEYFIISAKYGFALIDSRKINLVTLINLVIDRAVERGLYAYQYI